MAASEPSLESDSDKNNLSQKERRIQNGAGIPTICSVERMLVQASNAHLTVADLTQYIQKTANEVLVARIEGHMSRCRACEARYYRLLMSTHEPCIEPNPEQLNENDDVAAP